MSDVKSGGNAPALVKLIEEALRNNNVRQATFEIRGPISVATKDSKGAYKTTTLDGSEKLGLSSLYVGKRNQVILVFINKSPVNYYKFIEMDLDKAIVHLDDSFAAFVKDTLSGKLQTPLATVRNIAEIKAQEKIKRMENPNWGVW